MFSCYFVCKLFIFIIIIFILYISYALDCQVGLNPIVDVYTSLKAEQSTLK